ncbi:Uncharacterised protein [uncultured Clostridium sp.]|nr:Uncharacterised protein [uncultured Clostridium sp.]
MPMYPAIPITGASIPTSGPRSRSRKTSRMPMGNINPILVRAQEKIALVKSFPPCSLSANFL